MADNEVIEVGTAKFNSRVAALLPTGSTSRVAALLPTGSTSRVAALLPTGSATTNVAVESHNLGVWQHPWVPAL